MKAWFAKWSRWLHIYLSMFSFVIVLFFSATGLTLNHLDWFPETEHVVEAKGHMNPLWMQGDTSKIPKLAIVEYLRSSHQVKGLVNDFRIDAEECSVSFQGPGYTADVFIERSSGNYTISQTSLGFVAWMNDLHKGRDTSATWKWVIDASAIFLLVISLSGLILLVFLKKKRNYGIFWLILGAALCYFLI